MFMILDMLDYVRVEPELFAFPVKESIQKQLEKDYVDYLDEDLGMVIAVLEVKKVGQGVLIPGDPAIYYETEFELVVFKPMLQELVYGQISQIANFGAFVNIGATEAMMHISQTMDDYVTFSKTETLMGKNSKRTLKKGDLCLARIVAISYKTQPPKIGLTMRQPGLGKLDWIQEEKKKVERQVKTREKKGKGAQKKRQETEKRKEK